MRFYLKWWGFCSRVRKERSMKQMDWCDFHSIEDSVFPMRQRESWATRRCFLFTCLSVCIPNYPNDHTLWIVATRTRKMTIKFSFLCRIPWLSLIDVRNSVLWEGFGVELLLLHIEKSQWRWFEHPRISPERLPREVFWAFPSGRKPQEKDMLERLCASASMGKS